MGIGLLTFLLFTQTPSPTPESGQASRETTARIEKLGAELSSEVPETRDRASRELLLLGSPALEAMRRLADTGKDAEVRARAADIAKTIERSLRPKVTARFFFGSKERKAEGAWDVEEWLKGDALREGYVHLTPAGSSEAVAVPERRAILYPAIPRPRIGGAYVWGWLTEQTSEKAVITLCCSIKSWTSGPFTLDARTPRQLIRLADQSPLDDMLVVLELQSKSEPAKRQEKGIEK